MNELIINKSDLEIITKVLEKIQSNNCLTFILIGRDYYFYEIHKFYIVDAVAIDIDFDIIKIARVRNLKELQNYLERKKCHNCGIYHFTDIHLFSYDFEYDKTRYLGKITPSTNIIERLKKLLIEEDQKDEDVKTIDFKLFEYQEEIKLK